MSRAARVIAMGVLGAGLLGVLALVAPRRSDAAGPLLPLPPPPSLPATTPPASLEPLLVVAGPTVGALCGTASLGALLAPSLAEGFFKIPLEEVVDGHTLTQYADTALYVCGFVPSPLTPTECRNDAEIIDALRGLNPLAAQVVGLYPEGATVDTVIDLEQLLPPSAPIDQPVVTALTSLAQCSRDGAVPPVPHQVSAPPPPTPATAPVAAQPASPSPAPALQAVAPSTPPPAGAPLAAAASPTTPTSPITILQTRYLARHGPEWLALLFGLLLLAAAAAGRVWARGDDPT